LKWFEDKPKTSLILGRREYYLTYTTLGKLEGSGPVQISCFGCSCSCTQCYMCVQLY